MRSAGKGARLICLAAALAALVGACSKDGGAGEAAPATLAEAPTTSTSTATAPPATEVPTTTATASGPSTTTTAVEETPQGERVVVYPKLEQPALATTGEDFEAVAEEIVTYRAWLGQHPDPARLADIYLEECECYGRVHQALTNLQQAGESWDGSGPPDLHVELMDKLTPDAVRLIVVEKDNTGTTAIRNAAGEVVQLVEVPPGTPPQAERYFLKRGADGRWRVSDIFPIGPATPEQLAA